MAKDKKQMFAPINFYLAGKIFLALGIILIILNILDYLTSWFKLNNSLLIIGLVMILIGLYLIKIVGKS